MVAKVKKVKMMPLIYQNKGITKNEAITKVGGNRNEWLKIFDRWEKNGVIWVENTPNGDELHPYPISTQGDEILKHVKDIAGLGTLNAVFFRMYQYNKQNETNKKQFIKGIVGEFKIILKSIDELTLLTITPVYGFKVSILAKKTIVKNQKLLTEIMTKAFKIDPKLSDRIMSEVRSVVLN